MRSDNLIVLYLKILVRTFPILKNPVIYAFLFSFIYWIYLYNTTTPYIKYDAATFQSLAEKIYHGGWEEFFKVEPNYTPLYPLLLSISLRLADHFEVIFTKFQVFFQLCIIFGTQLLILKGLKKINVQNGIAAIVIFYFGVSPAIVNSALSIYSEIITYPLVLITVFTTAIAWRALLENNILKTYVAAVYIVVLFYILTMANPAFEYVLYFTLACFFVLGLGFLIMAKRGNALNTVIFVVLITCLFQLSLIPYKSMNLKFNGHKSLVIKGAWSFYANTFRRTEELTNMRVKTALAYVPGEGVCKEKFSEADCFFWSIGNQHGIGMRKLEELRNQGIPNDQLDSTLLALAQERILKKPAQFASLTALESLKMFFWESTQVGYVFYPESLTKLFLFKPFKNTLRLLTSLLTVLSLLFLIAYMLWNFRRFYDFDDHENIVITFLGFALVMWAGYALLHSFFCIATRYTFPVVGLYMIMIGFFLQKLFFRKT